MDSLYFQPNNLKLKTISFMRVPKLDWDDRRIELRQSEEPPDLLPKKLIICGTYEDIFENIWPFISLLDTSNWERFTTQADFTMIKCF